MKKLAINIILAAVFCFFTAQTELYINNIGTEVFSEAPKGYLAVIIDDFGYSGEGTEEILALDFPITAAVMPFSCSSKEDAAAVISAGKEYMVHMPMESLTGKKSWVGDKGVFTDMEDDEIKTVTEEALEILRDAKGMNNHMGSAIMEREDKLAPVFDVLKSKKMFFVDSMTTPNSASGKAAEDKGITLYKRDVFLDSTDDIEKIKANILRAGEEAVKNGKAIAIGHVGPEGGIVTAKALKEMEPKLRDMGVEFIYVSEFEEKV